MRAARIGVFGRAFLTEHRNRALLLDDIATEKALYRTRKCTMHPSWELETSIPIEEIFAMHIT